MDLHESLSPLPGILALDAAAVLQGTRRGASVQVEPTYFQGQLQVLDAVEGSPWVERRQQTLRQSAAVFDDVHVDMERLSTENLWDASRRLRGVLQQLPEVGAIQSVFPGTCLIVPEWLRTAREVQWGARLYLFREGHAPDPEELIQANVDGVVDDDSEPFDRLVGQLSGYPPCCIDFYHDRSAASAPETRSVAPFADAVADELLDEGAAQRSIDELVDPPDGVESLYRFFAKNFFPEPGCDPAMETGRAIAEGLREPFPDVLVEDFFRLNAGHAYLVAERLAAGAASNPPPGALGREHRQFFLPLGMLTSLSRYA